MARFIKDIKKYYRYMVYAAKADLKSEVTNAYLDWFWWILEPVCQMFIYYFVFGIVFNNREQYYLAFIYSGITLWTFFNRTMRDSVRLIKNSKSIITKVYIPKPILLLQKMLVNGFKMIVSCAIVVALMIPYRIPIDYHIFWLIPIFIILWIFSYGCGCILMHFGVYVDDLSYIVSILLNMMVYFTGIFYSIRDKISGLIGILLEKGNPIAFLISSMRDALLYQKDIPYEWGILWLIISSIIALIATKLIYKNENSYVKVI